MDCLINLNSVCKLKGPVIFGCAELWFSILEYNFQRTFGEPIVPFHKPLALGTCIVCIYYLIEKTLSLKKYQP